MGTGGSVFTVMMTTSVFVASYQSHKFRPVTRRTNALRVGGIAASVSAAVGSSPAAASAPIVLASARDAALPG